MYPAGTASLPFTPEKTAPWVSVPMELLLPLVGTDRECAKSVTGTIIGVGSNYTRAITQAEKYKDVAIIDGPLIFRKDGSGSIKSDDWYDIVAVTWYDAPDGMEFAGLRSDGSFVYSRGRDGSFSRARSWTDIQRPTVSEQAPETLTDPAAAYSTAEQFLANGEIAKAAIAFGKLGDYNNARERSLALWQEVPFRETITYTPDHSLLAIREDGTVAADDYNVRASGEGLIAAYYTENYRDIVSIYGYIGLKCDGTLVLPEREKMIQSVYWAVDGLLACYDTLLSWTDIVALAVSENTFIGLKSDGTVIAVGNNDYGQCDVEGWQDIIAISYGNSHTVGLKADGTVVATGNNTEGCCNVSDWAGIIDIATADNITVGLKADGTVVAAGTNMYNGITMTRSWHNVVKVEDGYFGPFAVLENGTVEAGFVDGSWDTAHVSGWNNVSSVTASMRFSAGLNKDGSMFFNRGYDHPGKYPDAKAWTDIQLP